MKPLKPIDQYNQITILKEVKERFGSINNFNKITGRQPTDLYYLKNYTYHKRSAVKQTIESIYGDIEMFQPKRLYLDDLDRSEIRQMIVEKYDTITAFSDDNSEFSTFWVSRIVNGNLSRITGKVKRLLETLEIEL